MYDKLKTNAVSLCIMILIVKIKFIITNQIVTGVGISIDIIDT